MMGMVAPDRRVRAGLGLFILAWSLWWVFLEMYQMAYFAAVLSANVFVWLWDGGR